jgi:hypothetical protein
MESNRSTACAPLQIRSHVPIANRKDMYPDSLMYSTNLMFARAFLLFRIALKIPNKVTASFVPLLAVGIQICIMIEV